MSRRAERHGAGRRPASARTTSPRVVGGGRDADRQQPARRRGARPAGERRDRGGGAGGRARLRAHPGRRPITRSQVAALAAALAGAEGESCSSAARARARPGSGRWRARAQGAMPTSWSRQAARRGLRSRPPAFSARGLSLAAALESASPRDPRAPGRDRPRRPSAGPARRRRGRPSSSRCRTGSPAISSASSRALGEARLEHVVELGGLDQRHYQGTTSPAASSSAVGLRPRIALRCGKRPKRCDHVVMLAGVSEHARHCRAR